MSDFFLVAVKHIFRSCLIVGCIMFSGYWPIMIMISIVWSNRYFYHASNWATEAHASIFRFAYSFDQLIE